MTVAIEETGTKTALVLAAGVTPGNAAVYARVARAAAVAVRPGEVYVCSSFARVDPGSLHDDGLAMDISKRQSTGSLWRLYAALLLERPDELFYRGKLLDKGTPFTDAELSADHLDHLHVGWDAEPSLIGGPGLPYPMPGGDGDKGSGSSGSGLSALLTGSTWVRAGEIVGGGLLVVGGLVVIGKRL